MGFEVSYVEHDGKKYAEVDDSGKVIFVDTDLSDDDPKKKTPIDVVNTYMSVPKLRSEAAGHRKAAEEAAQKLEAFKDIDPAKAVEALKVVQNLKDGDLVKANEVEALRKSIEVTYADEKKNILEVHATQMKSKDEEIQSLSGTIRNLLISNQFRSSSYFSGAAPKCTIPAEIAETYFGKHFKVENVNGEPHCVAYMTNAMGVEEKIYSKSNPGSLATFDEAMEIIINKYPGKDSILSSGKSGVGGPGSTNFTGVSGTVTRITRTQLRDPDFYKKYVEAKDKGQVFDIVEG